MKTYYFQHILSGTIMPIKANNNLEAMSKLSERVHDAKNYVLKNIQ